METLKTLRRALSEAREANEHYQQAVSLLSGGPASFYFDKVEEYIKALFERFAPFHEGDRVRLTAAPNTENGWSASKHFLIPGAEGTVENVDYNRGQFVADVVFDDESWIDCHGLTQPMTSKHTYRIGERILQRLDREQ